MAEPPSLPPPSNPPPGGSPPPEPPHAARTKRSSRVAYAIAWLVAVSILILPIGIAYLRKSEGDSAYAIGYAFGTGVAVIAIAVVVIHAFKRLTRTRRTIPAPLAVGAVALLAIGGQFALREDDRDDAVSDFRELVADCRAEQSYPFGSPPAGTRLRPLSSTETERLIAASLPPEGPVREAAGEAYVASQIVTPAGGAGVIVGIAGVGEGPAQAGFVSAVRAGGGQGRTVADLTVAGRPAISVSEASGSLVTFPNGCWQLVVIAPTAELARAFSDSMAG